jgi:hypothetical protein
MSGEKKMFKIWTGDRKIKKCVLVEAKVETVILEGKCRAAISNLLVLKL